MSEPSPSPRPYTLIAELTYRCPLRCVYCSNPLDYAKHGDKLTTADWLRVFRQAEDLGVLQVNLTGGEPLLRSDLEALVKGCSALDLYVNLITSGVPLTKDALTRLRDAGLSAFQLSFQDSIADNSDRLAGRVSFEQKLEVARWVKDLDIPLTLNFVIHRQNIERVADIITMAETLGADRLELANAQYLAWALENRTALLPTGEQLDEARAIAQSAKERLKGKVELLFVLPDYYSDRPKACMSGWGNRYIVIAPDGMALPCHLAHTLPGLQFETVQDRSLEDIWHHSAGFQAFRGESWMPDPCRTCERRTIDFGGCRCQAFHLAHDAALTDPACSLSPNHHVVLAARQAASAPPGGEPLVALRYRGPTR